MSNYYEELAQLAAKRGVVCESCVYYKERPDWGEVAGECHAPHVLGPPYWIHDYRRISVVCYAYRKRPDLVQEITQRSLGRDLIERNGLYWNWE